MTMAATLPRRPSEAERRAALVEAAEAIFLAQGYGATSMDDVAQAVGMSKKTLYQVFPSKEALFEAVVERFCAPMQVEAETAIPGDRAALERLLGDIAHHILSLRSVALFRVLAAEVKRAPELAAAVERNRGRKANALQRWLAEQAASGWLRISDPEEAAGMLVGMVIGEPHADAARPAPAAGRGGDRRTGLAGRLPLPRRCGLTAPPWTAAASLPPLC
jgi:AcrR family transcriptional regulator